ncbi:MAG: hypothetical protein M3040_00540 [Bacteroidota bacterium]|nr:hypothetical protein [Bacteroidota bacterium]
MASINVLVLRFEMVIIIGGLSGAERELKSKSAGSYNGNIFLLRYLHLLHLFLPTFRKPGNEDG